MRSWAVSPAASGRASSTVIRPSGLDQRSAGTGTPSTATSETVSRVSRSTTRRATGAVAVKSSTATASIALSSGMTLIDRSALSRRSASCSGARGWSVPRVKAVDSRACMTSAGGAGSGSTQAGESVVMAMSAGEAAQAATASRETPIRAARRAILDTEDSPRWMRPAYWPGPPAQPEASASAGGQPKQKGRCFHRPLQNSVSSPDQAAACSASLALTWRLMRWAATDSCSSRALTMKGSRPPL